MSDSKINLGDVVQDPITGFKGTAIARTTWITGCDRITVKPSGVNKEGKTYESDTFDEPGLIVLKKAKVQKVETKKGGPRPMTPKY